MIAILWWTRGYPVIQMSKEAEITEDTAYDIYQWFREGCSAKLLNTPVILGGPGVIVSRILTYFTNILFFLYNSIIEEGLQQQICGYLYWSIPRTHLL